MPGEDELNHIEKLRQLRMESHLGGGQKRIESQHEKGKMTAHERIEYLADSGTFKEISPFTEHQCTDFGLDKRSYLGDGVVVGYCEINNRKCFVFSHDFTVLGGSVGEVVADKITRAIDQAIDTGVPIVGLNDSGGARIQEGINSLGGFARIFKQRTSASGIVPQITCIMGPCAGGATYSPALTDFTFMVSDTSHMMITGPDVVEKVTGEQISKAELGGAVTHTEKSGVAHAAYENETDALDGIRRLLSYLPQNNKEKPPMFNPKDKPNRCCDELIEVVPTNAKKPYNMVKVIKEIFDRKSFFEIHRKFAQNIIVGFARLNGQTVGIVANQPCMNAGTIDIDASEKAARFVRTCDTFNIPIITIVDTPGFLPGSKQEHNGIIRHGAKLIYAYAEATVPLFTTILRKAYGGAYIVMGSKELGADRTYAWPTAEIAVLGPQSAIDILYRDEIAAADDLKAKRDELIKKYQEKFANPYEAAKSGYIDNIIEPETTRQQLIDDLDIFDGKSGETHPRNHGNIPL